MKYCANCHRELDLLDDDGEIHKETRSHECEFCFKKICDECFSMSLCQSCFKDGCKHCLTQCEFCREYFCFICIDYHLQEEKRKQEILLQLKKKIKEEYDLFDSIKEIILSSIMGIKEKTIPQKDYLKEIHLLSIFSIFE